MQAGWGIKTVAEAAAKANLKPAEYAELKDNTVDGGGVTARGTRVCQG